MALDAPNPSTPVVLRYRNREITEADLEFLKGLCASPWERRGDLVQAVCSAWEWRQPNGSASIYACSDLLLRLEERRLLQLPRPAHKPPRQKRGWLNQLPIPVDLIPLVGLPLRDPDADLGKVVVRPIEAKERLGFRVYMERYHPLGDRPMVGEHLMYAAFLGSELVALLGWASAALRVVQRDAYVGWDEGTKRRRLHLVTNNVRFLVLPWIRVRHLASRVLALNLHRLSTDWQRVWNHPVLLAETFVDPARHRGTCYRAANWRYLGETAGRSKRGNQYLHGGTKKAVYVYPLHRDATRILRDGAQPGRPARAEQ
jgi:uncharacterized protein DUF4338